MKRVIIKAYEAGLLFKSGKLKQVLKEGKYWFWENVIVEKFDITKQFTPYIDLNILLENQSLREALDVIFVQEHELGIHFENGLFKQVLKPGRYAFWKSVIDNKFIIADTSKIDITEEISATIIMNKLASLYVRIYTVESYEKALLFVDGKFTRLLEPGIYTWWKNNIAIHVAKADMRTQQMEINGQEILTKDKATLRINAWAQFRIADFEKALLHNKEFDKQLYVAFQLALREYVAGLGFDELLEKKEAVETYVIDAVKTVADDLGISILGFGVRDIILPGDMKEIMNQVLIAEKRAQANSITRREETAATRSLLNTAKLMEENAMLWKLKEMEYVEKIAEKISHISVNGNGDLVGQLKQIFIPQR